MLLSAKISRTVSNPLIVDTRIAVLFSGLLLQIIKVLSAVFIYASDRLVNCLFSVNMAKLYQL